MKKSLIAGLLLSFLYVPAQSRPLVTEEASTLGKYVFEVGTGISFREDEFGFPKSQYETVTFPFIVNFGLTNQFQFGFTLQNISQRIETGDARLSGSQSALFSPQIKFSKKNLGFLAIWHISNDEQSNQDLPIGRGNDVELVGLISGPGSWNPQLNVGYIFKGDYDSNFGIELSGDSQVEPGNIFLSRASIEIPIRYNINFLNELAYYNVAERKIAGAKVANSQGDALDILTGLTWVYKGWNIGGLIGFGLLEESHTSFDLTRGAGDVFYKFSLSYRLKPRKPEKWE